MDKERLNWRSFADPGGLGQRAIATKWNLVGTPTFYIIDHKGVIRHKWVGSPGEKTIDTALEKLIKEAEDNGKRLTKDSAGVLFRESFDDPRLLQRGWYDGDKFTISAKEPKG